MRELVYTSARAGLRPGTTGFCTVAMTDGLPAPVVEFLERLSNTYQPLYMPYDPRAGDNPAAVSLVRGRPGGYPVAVLSRNAAAGADHTGRTNNLAHHLVFDGAGPGDGSNPAAVAAQPGAFLTRWDDPPRRLPSRRLAGAPGPRGACRAWDELTGDAGWAAAVAAAWVDRAARPLHLVYPAGTDVLALLAEAASLLPADRRWEATFTTYYTGLPAEATCAVRGVLAGSPQEAEARRADCLDLLDLAGPAPDGPLADRARGRAVPDEVFRPARPTPAVPARRPAATPAARPDLPKAERPNDPDEPPRPAPFSGLDRGTYAGGAGPAGRGPGVLALALGGWAVVSTGAAAALAIAWAVNRTDGGSGEHSPPADPPVARASPPRDEPPRAVPKADPPKADPPVRDDPLPEPDALAKLENKVRDLETKLENERKETKKLRDELKDKPKPPKEKDPPPRPPAPARTLPELFEALKSNKNDLDRWLAFQRLSAEWPEVRKQVENEVKTGDLEVQERAHPADKAAGKVYAVAKPPTFKAGGNDHPLPLAEGGVYVAAGWYTSEPGEKTTRPTFLPRSGEPVNPLRNVRLRHKAGGFAEKDLYYLEPDDPLRAAVREDNEGNKQVILVLRKESDGPAYLLWLKKKAQPEGGGRK